MSGTEMSTVSASSGQQAAPKAEKCYKVIQRPGIPVAFPGTGMASTLHWQLWWWLGAGLLSAGFFGLCHSQHRRVVYPLTAGAAVDIDLNLQGCDFSFQQNTEGVNDVLVRYYTMLTSSQAQVGDESFALNTTASSKWTSFRCEITFRTHTTTFRNVRINIVPDLASPRDALPSNVKGLVTSHFDGGFRAENLAITSEVYSEVAFKQGPASPAR